MPGTDGNSSRMLDQVVALLERELRRADTAAGQSVNATPDATTDSLRKDARDLLKEKEGNPARFSQDPDRSRDWFLKATALMATDRMLTLPAGFRLDAVDDPVSHLRIQAGAGRHPPESSVLQLLNVRGLAAVTGRMSLARDAAGEEQPSDLADQAFPQELFEHATYLLMQQVQNGNAGARLSRGLRSDVASCRLDRTATAMIKDMAVNNEVYVRAPFLTTARLLRLAALLGADRLLSHQDGIGHDGLGDPDRCIRTYVTAERHAPESLELMLPAVPMR